MAKMTERKKWGLRIIITAVVAAVVGTVVFFTTETPEWLYKGLGIVEAVLGLLGVGLLWKADPK